MGLHPKKVNQHFLYICENVDNCRWPILITKYIVVVADTARTQEIAKQIHSLILTVHLMTKGGGNVYLIQFSFILL